jgi:hypothetical protein
MEIPRRSQPSLRDSLRFAAIPGTSLRFAPG